MGDLQLRTTGIKLKQMRSNVQQQNIMVVNSGNSPLYTIIESQIPYVSATMVPNILKPNQKGEIQLIRYADKDKDRTICIRLKKMPTNRTWQAKFLSLSPQKSVLNNN